MRYFEQSDRIGSDGSALDARMRENISIHDYKMQNRIIQPTDIKEKATQIVNDNPNMRWTDGMDPKVIDINSSIRYTEQTNIKEKQQLNIRYFHAIPNLAKGSHKPDIESELMNGETSTSSKSSTFKNAEIDFQRFVPFVNLVREAQQCSTHVPDIHSIGIDTRQLMRMRQSIKNQSIKSKNCKIL